MRSSLPEATGWGLHSWDGNLVLGFLVRSRAWALGARVQSWRQLEGGDGRGGARGLWGTQLSPPLGAGRCLVSYTNNQDGWSDFVSYFYFPLGSF